MHEELAFLNVNLLLYKNNLEQDSILAIQETVHPYFNWENGFLKGIATQADSATTQQITESFLPASGIAIDESQMVSVQSDWMTFLLFGLLFGIALLWYFIPERLLSIFNFPTDSGSKRLKDSGYNSPGFLISSFLSINYLVTFSLFVFLILNQVSLVAFNKFSEYSLLVLIASLILILYLFRIIFIRVNGFLFKTKIISKQQQLVYVNVDNLMGILLIPIILLVLYSNANVFILLGIFVILIIHLFRWLQTFILGKSITGFSLFHLFMYLCTLEILPLIVLIKILESGLI